MIIFTRNDIISELITIGYIYTEFLISSYGAQLAQRASYLALHSSFFGTGGAINYDYIVTNSIFLFVNWLKMYSQWRIH